MLLRSDELVITQPAHAWLSGQLARAWAGPFAPREVVCLAAEQHDVGWVEEDLEPRLNPETGRPRSFMQMPLAVHLTLWREAAYRMVAQSRYAGLLVSLHGTSLYETRERTPEIEDYLASQRELQRHLSAGLDPHEVDANRRLIRAWDRMSLAICLDWEPGEVPDVPGFGTLRQSSGTLEPWPLREDRVVLHTEALRLAGTFDDERALRRAFAAAERVPLEFTLRKAEHAAE